MPSGGHARGLHQVGYTEIIQAMWLLRDYNSRLGHCTLSKQLRNSVLNSLNSAKVYIMEQHTAAELTFHNDGKQMIGGWQNKFSKFNHPKLIFVVVSS